MLLWEKMKKAAEYHHEKQAQKEEAYREQYGEGGRELEKLGKEIGVNIRCQREEIFEKMHRL